MPEEDELAIRMLPERGRTGAEAASIGTIAQPIEKAGCRVLLLPPYSPEWNPIEPCWSKIKEFLHARAARTLQTLETAVVDAMDAVSQQDAHGWVHHCGYRIALD